MNLLDIPWGVLNKTGRNTKGSFHEVWMLQWDAKFALAVIQAGSLGNTVIEAAGAKVIAAAKSTQSLADISQLMNAVLLADLPLAIAPVSQALEDLAAGSSDILQLLAAIPPLVQIVRYGNVRHTDVTMVEHVLHSLVPRSAVALPHACSALDDEAAKEVSAAIIKSHHAIRLLAHEDLLAEWLAALARLVQLGKYHGLISGLASRMLFDVQVQTDEQIALQMSQALSIGVEPHIAAAWLEGFLNNSGMILLGDEKLWQLVNSWMIALDDEYFLEILPLLRRTFSAFSPSERRQLGEKARQGKTAGIPLDSCFDVAAAEQVLPYIRLLLGVSS